LFDLARSFFIDVSRITPLVIILEDLHWSDRASLDMLRHIARHIENHPILMLGTYRDDEIARDDPLFQLLPTLVRESQALRIKLDALDRADLQQLVRANWTLNGRDEQRLIDFLLGHAEGHPLFHENLLPYAIVSPRPQAHVRSRRRDP
jgi:predicted ATPase